MIITAACIYPGSGSAVRYTSLLPASDEARVSDPGVANPPTVAGTSITHRAPRSLWQQLILAQAQQIQALQEEKSTLSEQVLELEGLRMQH